MIDETDLVARAQQGDKQALAAIIAAHQDTVYHVALRMCGNVHDAEETLQETFLNALTALPSFEGRARFSTWLYRIASNACLMRRRTESHQPELLSLEPLGEEGAGFSSGAHEPHGDAPRYFVDWSGLPEAALLDAELHGVMEEAITALPPDLRIVFLWRDLEGLSTAETAQVLEISGANVKVRLHRARLQLRAALSAYLAGRPEGEAEPAVVPASGAAAESPKPRSRKVGRRSS